MRHRPLLLLALVAAAVTAAEPELFPFVLPWDDASGGLTNLSELLPRPAGAFGPVRAGADGHLYTGDRRLRLFGVDQAFSANFPTHEQADKVAGRLAKFGVNIMRFHIMDMSRYPNGLLASRAKSTREFEPEALDRLDYYTGALRARGIYVYLCLLNYRPFNAADGLPPEIETLGDPYQGRHVVGFWDPAQQALQREYAQRLLTHRNAYTGLTYAEDPAVAFVEINNENGLVHAWLSQTVDKLPAVFLNQLAGYWNAWLKRHYPTTAALRTAWARSASPLGDEVLANGDFGQGFDHWFLELHEPARATATVVADAPAELPGAKSVCLDVSQVGREVWHIRCEQGERPVQAEQSYALTGWAKAERPGVVRAGLEQFHEPWHTLGSFGTLAVGPRWQRFRLVTRTVEADPAGRLVFDPPLATGKLWLAGLSLRPGGVSGLAAGESLEQGNIALLPHATIGERSSDALADWCRFLWETEQSYWQTLRGYVKDELKVRGLVIGTVTGCSTPNLMAPFGVIDGHAYWEHPSFPGRPWDGGNWIVRNNSMVNARGGVLPGLALKRVLNLPFCITEYGEPAPNTHVSEVHLLRAAYGSLQDWDYLSASRYAQRNDFDRQSIRGFFDIDQHPTSLLALLPAAALYLRGDVAPARRQVVAPLGREQEVALLPRQHSWDLVSLGVRGVRPETALIHRVALAVEGQSVPVDALRPDQVPPAGDRLVADTGELAWDLSRAGRGVVTIDTARSKAVIGYGGGRRFDLGGVVIEPGPTRQDGWSVLSVTALAGELRGGAARVLVTATGDVENTGMRWKNPEKSSVGRDWGGAPTLVEGVPARLTLPWSVDRARAWALDERGQRRVSVPLTPAPGDRAMLELGPQWRTLWYEVEAH